MADLSFDNPATSGSARDPMHVYGSELNNPATVHTSTDKRSRVSAGNKFQFNAMTPQFSKFPKMGYLLNKAFLTGFCEKCAEHKISPFALISKNAI